MSDLTPSPAPPPAPPQMEERNLGRGDGLIFNKWVTSQFIIAIWTRADGVVQEVEIRLRPSSPFAGRCRCGGRTRVNLARAIMADVEMVDGIEQAVP